MEIFELWTHVLEEIKIKNPEYYNNFYSFVFPISFSDGIFTAMATVPYMIPWINAVYKTKLEKSFLKKRNACKAGSSISGKQRGSRC